MKKPYSCIKAVCTMALILLLQTSFAQEVETQQQQTNTGQTNVQEGEAKADLSNLTEQSEINTLSDGGLSRASTNTDNSYFDEIIQNFMTPVDPNAALPYQASHTVDHCTGKVNVKVPIAVAGPKDIPVPIELNYSTGGIKLGQRASWVGLGWNLSAGGKITRMLNKFPDKLDGSMDTLAHYTGWTFYLTTDKNNQGNFEDRMKHKDSQPDLFTFEIPGKSGTFVFDSRGNAYTIPYQNIKINYDKENEIFEIIDDMGTKYLFEHKEITEIFTTSETVERNDIKCISTWHLSNITNIKGEFVTFEYKPLDIAVNKYQKYEIDTYQHNTSLGVGGEAGGGTTSSTRRVSYSTEVHPLFLTTISWRNGHMDFKSSMQRRDYPTEAYQLDMIWIYSDTDASTRVKMYDFKYSAFTGCDALKLDRINVYNTPKASTPEFYRAFEYYTQESVPAISLGNHYYEHDHWGFYNGITNNKLGIPRMYLLDENLQYVAERPAYDDRKPVLAKAMLNSLKRIWGTTSAYDEFEYELNESYDKVDYFSGYTVGGLRIKSITTKSEELPDVSKKVRYEYLDTNGKSSGVVFNNPAYYHKTTYDYDRNVNFYVLNGVSNRSLFDLDGSHIRYKRVRELFDNGSSNTYTFTTYADRPDDGFYVHPVASYGYHYNYDALKSRNCDFAPTNTRFWERGLLTEKVSKNNLDSVTYRETYEYEFDAPVLKEIKGIFPFVYQSCETGKTRPLNHAVGQYHYLSRPIYKTKQTVGGIDIPETVTTYTYDDTYAQLKKETVKCGNDKYITTYKYPFEYNGGPGTEEGNVITFMKANNIFASPIEIVKYKNDKVVGGEIYIYNKWNYTSNGSITGSMFNLKEVKQLQLKKPKLQSEFTESNFTRFSSTGFRFSYDSNYVTKTVYEYNRNNKPSCIKERNKPSRLFLYGNDPELPIAQLSNAEAKVINGAYYEEAFYTSFEDEDGTTNAQAKTGTKVRGGGYSINLRRLAPGTYCVSFCESTNNGTTWTLNESELEVTENDDRVYTVGRRPGVIIDEYRIWKKGAQMQTKNYNSNKAATSETDQNGKTIYYEYDPSGRVTLISDNNRSKVKSYEYFIKTK